MIGATDGHAKNFSLMLRQGGGYALAPLYDVLTAQPSLTANQITRRQMKLAMSVGRSRHYRLDKIAPRHFFQTAEQAGLPASLVRAALEDVAAKMDGAITALEAELPGDFPQALHEAVTAGIRSRMQVLEAGLCL